MAGHAPVKKSPDDGLAVRKVIETSVGLCADAGLSDWRRHAYHVRCLKKAYRRTQKVKCSRAKDET